MATKKKPQKDFQIWSAANMAPFMAVPSAKAQVEEDLNWLYNNNVAYTKNFWDGSTAKVLWRYSVTGLFFVIFVSEKFKKFQKNSKS